MAARKRKVNEPQVVRPEDVVIPGGYVHGSRVLGGRAPFDPDPKPTGEIPTRPE
jgi:hypothetical protein